VIPAILSLAARVCSLMENGVTQSRQVRSSLSLPARFTVLRISCLEVVGRGEWLYHTPGSVRRAFTTCSSWTSKFELSFSQPVKSAAQRAVRCCFFQSCHCESSM